jgi:O-methyltransferase involved in polyketide biosynthesis
LNWPEQVCLFEIDLSDVLAFKARVLSESNAQPGCRRVTESFSTGVR